MYMHIDLFFFCAQNASKVAKWKYSKIMKQSLQCINNSYSFKEISRLKNKTRNKKHKNKQTKKKEKQETATSQMKAEVNAKQSNAQTNRQ